MNVRRQSLIWAVCLGVLVGGCGLGRTVLNVKHPSAGAAVATPSAPVAVKLMTLVDARHFEVRPRQANMPSLNANDVGNPKLTARAIGRKRGSFGKARGDLMLPTDSSVQALTRACLATAIGRAGGVLVDEGDPRYASALPLDVTIAGFWSWLRPGAFVIAVEFDAALVLRAPLPGLEQGASVIAHSEMRRPAMNDARWKSVVEQGLATLTDNLSKQLTPAFAARSASVASVSSAQPITSARTKL